MSVTMLFMKPIQPFLSIQCSSVTRPIKQSSPLDCWTDAKEHRASLKNSEDSRLSITADLIMSSSSDVPSGWCAAKPIHLPSDAHKQSVNITARIVLVHDQSTATDAMLASRLSTRRRIKYLPSSRSMLGSVINARCPPVYKSRRLRAESRQRLFKTSNTKTY